MASAVTRPEVIYWAPLKVRMEGSTAMLGPIRVHAAEAASGDATEVVLVEVVAAVRLLIRSKAPRAFKVAEKGISVAG
jgi:hypothetical protein